VWTSSGKRSKINVGLTFVLSIVFDGLPRRWNGLPAKQRDFCSLIQFTNFINGVDLSIYVSLGF